MGFDIKVKIKEFKPHAHTHHVIIIVIVIIIAILNLCYSITSHTNPLLSHIHVNTTKLLNMTCTLVATSVILRSLECINDTMCKCCFAIRCIPTTSIMCCRFMSWKPNFEFNI